MEQGVHKASRRTANPECSRADPDCRPTKAHKRSPDDAGKSETDKEHEGHVQKLLQRPWLRREN